MEKVYDGGPMIEVNGRRYALPRAPVVVVCVDGCEPDYLDRAVEGGAMPWFGSARAGGTSLVGDCVMPSFTNPNNLSIVTGAPPSVHGISGNYFWDPQAGVEVMMNDPKYLRAETILARLAGAGAPGAGVAAQGKPPPALRTRAPGASDGMLEGYLERLDALAATTALTADHGMNAKTDAAGRPQVVYLQDSLDAWLGAGRARVILPITDPYVVHHGALGSFATVYLPAEASVEDAIERLERLPGMEAVLDRKEACRRVELPQDPSGDAVPGSERHPVGRTSAARPDLPGLDAPPRPPGR